MVRGERRRGIHRDDGERRAAIRSQRLAPEKRFYFVANENCNCSECPYMKLQHAGEAARLPAEPGAARGTVRRDHASARGCPIERMLAVK